MKVCLISLGCPKNLIDSEVMAGRINASKMDMVYDPEDADVAVVNTCGFIEAAVEESRSTILDLCRLKEAGLLKGIVVAGCLVQRFRGELIEQIPEVDAFLTISDYSGLGRAIEDAARGERSSSGRRPSRGGQRRSAETDLSRALLTPSHTAYLRIAEGCNHQCSFCAIPSIRGRLRSKPETILLEEVGQLARLGVKELNLVAEDTTDYGRDLESGSTLAGLLDTLSTVSGIEWIRILYAFPSRVTDELIETIARSGKVVNYIDVPIQHISGPILRSMRRGTTPASIVDMIKRLRAALPGIVLRTSVIVGYPGESAARFDELFEFLERVRFERLGAFGFSPESGTAAHELEPRLPREVVDARIEKIMEFQRRVIEERNISLVGQTADAIVDVVSGDRARGRTEGDAPDIDCGVDIVGGGIEEGLEAGEIVKVRFTGHSGYDLIAQRADCL